MAATVERFDQVAVGGTSCASEVIGIGTHFLLFLLSLQTCQLLSRFIFLADWIGLSQAFMEDVYYFCFLLYIEYLMKAV